MPHWSELLEQKLQNPFALPVYYFASAEQAQLRAAAKKTLAALLAEDNTDYTRLDGPQPDFGALVEAAGTISLFGTPRVVELKEINPASFSDKDIAETAELFGLLQNAVLVVTALYADTKAAEGKRAQKLFAAAEKHGFAALIKKPTARETLAFITAAAQNAGAAMQAEAARLLLERVGDDHVLLQNEVEKLAAICRYGEITPQAVARCSAANIEADVFLLAQYITGRRKAGAYQKLQELFVQRAEPLAISGALSGSFVDMYRARCGAEQKLPSGTVFREMGYKGNEYRMQKAREAALKYTPRQLERSILCLAGLDRSLKSSALSDKTVLVEAAVGTLLQIGAAR